VEINLVSGRKINHGADVAAPSKPDARVMRIATLTSIGLPLLGAVTSVDRVRSGLSMMVSRTASDLIGRWRGHDERSQILRFVQPSLIGLIDSTISTLPPIFAAAFIAGSHAALLVGLAASLGAAISMGLWEALSDDGELSGRGNSLVRGTLDRYGDLLRRDFPCPPLLYW
jgi:hypothetical protein